jgi:hypothetical protein
VQTPVERYLDYGANNPDYGTVSISSGSPDADGCYAYGASVSLLAETTDLLGVTFSHWLIDGANGGSSPSVNVTMEEHKTVHAVFAQTFTVNDTSDAEGSGSSVTLRYALTNIVDGGVINLPAGATITLTSPLPDITRSITINGNGATLTHSMETSESSMLLYIYGAGVVVKISRLHFKNGNLTGGGFGGAAIRNNVGRLTVESCIFSDNQVTGSGNGGAIYSSGNAAASLTVLGCTFYNNKATNGGAIHRGNGIITLTGNLFLGNTANNGKVVYGTVSSITSGGYNVSDNAAVTGTTAGSGSGYAAATGDLFSITDITFATSQDPTTAPSSGSNLKTLTALPEGFPTTYFDGSPRDIPATAGAVAVTP